MNQTTELGKFAEMLGRLSYVELEKIQTNFVNYGADKIFIDLCEMEIDARRG